MFCEKCGKELSGGARFCNFCGAKVYEAAAENAEYSNVITEEISPEPAPVEIVPAEKKGIKKYVIAGVCAVVVIALALGFLLRNNIFYALMPERYVGNLISNTYEAILKDAEAASKNVFGFSYDKDDALTGGFEVDIKEDYEGGAALNAKLDIADSPDDREVSIDGDVSYTDDEIDIKTNVSGFWNDEYIGFALEEADDKYYVIPSKDFGDGLMKSIIGDELSVNTDFSGLDISYSKLYETFDTDNREFKALKKDLWKETLKFLDQCSMSDKESVKFRFDGDTVNAKSFTVTAKLGDLADFAINSLEILRDSDYFDSFVGSSIEIDGETLASLLDEAISELKDSRGSIDNEEFDIEFIEYKGKIVSILLEADETEIEIKSTDKNSILNGYMYTVRTEYQTAEVEVKSNWVTEDEDIFINESVYQNGSEAATYRINLDYGSGQASIKAGISEVGEYKFSGTCFKEDGFTLTIDDVRIPQDKEVLTNSMGYDEWFDETYRNGEDMNYSYYYDNDNYDALWDIYFDDFWYDYDSYSEWYDAEGATYDQDYMSYDEWLDEIYDSEDSRWLYDSETGDYEYIDYDLVMNFTFTLKKGANVEIKNREYVNLFEQSEKELEEIGEKFLNIGAKEPEADMAATAQDPAGEPQTAEE